MDAHATQSLFRREALNSRAHRLHGDISLAQPLSWQLIGYLLFAAFVVALIFLATASYSRVETVPGAVVLDKGVVSIVPSRAGIVAEVAVHEGMSVAVGDILAKIRSEEHLARGDTAPGRILSALGEQDQWFEAQAALLIRAADEEQARLREQIKGLTSEIAGLDAQIVLQARLTQLAESEFRHARTVAEKGYISQRDLQASESALLGRRQQLFQLKQGHAVKSAELSSIQRAVEQSMTAAQAQAANVSSSRAQVAQQMAQAESAQGYALRSPIAGTVTALTARVGQTATAAQPMMLVVPARARTLAELYIPSSAVGFLKAGQEVRLNVDAFPYQRFGVIVGRIVEIATAATLRTMPDGASTPVYMVTVMLQQPWIMGFGHRQSLLPGMTLSARIITRRQTLIEWLFEPVYSLSRR